jgi:very-short-patch-repair endonuclease
MREESAMRGLFIAKVAARQHGVVSSAQLRDAGVSKDAVLRWTRSGRLYRIYRGVYAVGHPGLGTEGRWMAAVLACGPGAALSHHSAAALWELLKPRSGPIDVTVAGDGGRRPRRGIRLHRSTSFGATDRTMRHGIAVTTPARTIEDLRRIVSPSHLRRAIRQAELLGLPLNAAVQTDRTRSELERLFLRLCRRHGIPTPEVNVRVGPFDVDFLWRGRRLVVEVDSFRYHGTRSSFESDRARDAHLKTLGYDIVRFTDRQLIERSATIVVTLNALLSEPSES